MIQRFIHLSFGLHVLLGKCELSPIVGLAENLYLLATPLSTSCEDSSLTLVCLILTLRGSVCCVTAPSPVTVPGPHRAALKPDRYRLDPSVGGNGAV